MTSAVWNLIFFCIALGILVTIHEGGHYFAARLCKVKVYRFALGFGPVIYRRILRNGTEFAICLLPLGGYVKMKGEYDDKEEDQDSLSSTRKGSFFTSKDHKDASVDGTDQSKDGVIETDFAHIVTSKDVNIEDLKDSYAKQDDDLNDSFDQKTIGQRAFIIAAGPLSNMLLAVVLFWLAFMMGVSGLKSVVGEVIPGTIAAESGFKEYDFIKSIDGKSLDNWRDASVELISGIGSKVDVTVQEDLGKGPERKLVLDLSGIELSRNTAFFDEIGLNYCVGKIERKIFLADKENSAAAKAGLKDGDIVLAVNGVPCDTWYAVSRALRNSGFDGTDITVLRNGQEITFNVIPGKMERKGQKEPSPFFGIGVEVEPIPELYSTFSYGPVEAMVHAYRETLKFSTFIFTTLNKLITGHINADNISGPIAIAQGAGESAEYGLTYFLQFLAMLSVNLGILNLLPIPILDGGQLIFLAYEKVVGKKLNPAMQNSLLYLGLCLLLGFTFLAIFNDIAFL